MCGIFGFVLNKPVPMVRVFRVLERLEAHRYPQEPRPVGGYGAGVTVLENDEVKSEKIGKTSGSPVEHLSKITKIEKARVLIGHVRMPSPQFMDKAQFPETAQPYVTRCNKGLTVVSAHNGYVRNYAEIRQRLGKEHVFESEKVELVDSEVIPHSFEKYLEEKKSTFKALGMLHSVMEGSNAIALLQSGNRGRLLHFIHKGGETRGLFIWRNEEDETVFCSRKEPTIEAFNDILIEHKFEEKVSIPYHKDESLNLSFPISGKT